MAIQGAQTGIPCPSVSEQCPDKFGCTPGVCPDFLIKRHDTKPPLKVSVEDCDGAIDFTEDDLVLEVNMWAKAKLKKAITNTDTFFAFADNIGFEQVMVGDIIIMDRARLPEHMLVTAFDEQNCFVQVVRGYNGTQAQAWKRGAPLRIFRILNGPGEIETILDDIVQTDGTTLKDQVIETLLTFEWSANSTCLPGCYLLEFKLLKMTEGSVSMLAATGDVSITSFTPSTLDAEDFGCILGEEVLFCRRFPPNSEGFLIQIIDSPTAELV